MTSLGLYLHIPFCRSKCAYCDFYSLPRSEGKMDAFAAALAAHLALEAPRAADRLTDTVYFGGGTPSCLGAERLCALLAAVKENYRVAEDAEITLEANPDSLGDASPVRRLREAGFNRVSLGVQSADDGELARLGRPHTFAQAEKAASAAREAGFTNVSLDLIYGLPDQTLPRWRETLRRAAALEPDHLSCYGLKVEEGTPLWRERDALRLPDDDRQADMYLCAVEYLTSLGFAQYEISNFARPGFESRHNLKYWTMGEYIGFGPGAHGDFGGVRFSYPRDLDGYVSGVAAGVPPRREEPRAGRRERAAEYLMLGLRTAAGVSRAAFEGRCGLPFAPAEEVLSPLAPLGLAAETEDGWRLTPRGFLVSNEIIVRVLMAEGL